MAGSQPRSPEPGGISCAGKSHSNTADHRIVPFTYPAFDPSDEQLQNMKRLMRSFWSRARNPARYDSFDARRLFRARATVSEGRVSLTFDEGEGVTNNLIKELIKEKQSAPMRYGM